MYQLRDLWMLDKGRHIIYLSSLRDERDSDECSLIKDNRKEKAKKVEPSYMRSRLAKSIDLFENRLVIGYKHCNKERS
jgi:hypothetical protein